MQTQEAQGDSIALDDLYAVGELASTSRHLKEATLRWQLRNRDTNGLAIACVHVGKKLLISKTRYELWLGTQAGRIAA